MRTCLLEEMTWTEIEKALSEGCRTVIITAGSIEQHGPHLSQITDTLIGQASAVDLAKRLGDALVAPVIRPGLSSHHLPLPGSLSLRPEVFAGIVEDYVSCYARHGFEIMVLFSSHGGNFEALEKIAADLRPKYPRAKIVTGLSLAQLLDLLAGMEQEEGLAEGSCGGHACDFETSVMLALHPEHVCMERSARGHVGRPSGELLEKLFRDGVTAVSPLGVLGDPTGADVERGKRYFNRLQDKLTSEVKRKLAGS